MPIIAPSLLSADFARLADDLTVINRSEADWLHLDIMDGLFVPNLSFGYPVLEAVKKHCRKPADVHLMIQDPDRYIERFAEAGASVITVHYEACPHLHRTVQAIKATGRKAGVALNPHTPVCLLEDILSELDMVLLMSVNPGFGGQRFIERTPEKVRNLRRMIDERNLKTLIEVDGGVNAETGKRLVEAGADALVAGNFVFKSADPAAAILSLKRL